MTEFLAMGGYAEYVWSAYFITLVVLVGNVVLARSGLKQIKRQIVSRIRRESRKS